MNPIEQAILELLAGGPSSMRPLVARHPRASVYEALRRFRARGAVVPGETAGVWRLAPGGSGAAPASVAPPATPPWPTLPIPHLDGLPSREHRALGALILLAATARRHYEHHHASFALYSSSGLRGKTFLARWAALALGGGEVLHAVAEGGRSLGARRRGDGQIAAVRAALAGMLLCIDEWRRGSSDVRRITTMLISGDRSIPLEDESITVAAVILLAMNSPVGATTVESATGLDAAMIRRLFAACMQDITLDPTFARDGEERLDRVRATGAVTLPEIRAGVVDERAIRDRIADALEVVLDNTERTGSLDNVLLSQLVVAAVAWGLSVEEAVALVLHASSVVWSTTGWTRPDWEARLAAALNLAGPVPEAAPAPEVEPVVIEADLELDYGARLSQLDRVAREHDAGDPDVLGERLELATAVSKVGLGRGDLEGLVRLLRVVRGEGGAQARLAVLTAMDEAGIAPDEATRLFALVAAGGGGLGLEHKDVLVVLRGIEQAGLDPSEVGAWAVWSMGELGRLDGEINEARRELREWRRAVRESAEDLATANARVRKLSKILERAEKEPALARALRFADTEREREVFDQIMLIAEQISGVAQADRPAS